MNEFKTLETKIKCPGKVKAQQAIFQLHLNLKMRWNIYSHVKIQCIFKRVTQRTIIWTQLSITTLQ